MPNTKQIETNNIEKKIIEKVVSGEIAMRPRWYFVAGSTLTFWGTVLIGILTAYLFSLITFILKHNGPINPWRLVSILGKIPIWIPPLAPSGIVAGI